MDERFNIKQEEELKESLKEKASQKKKRGRPIKDENQNGSNCELRACTIRGYFSAFKKAVLKKRKDLISKYGERYPIPKITEAAMRNKKKKKAYQLKVKK